MSNAYAQIADLEIRYDTRQIAQLSNDNDNAVQVDANVQAALDDAAAELDSVLANRVPIPLSTVPSNLTRGVCATAFMRLYGRRGDAPEDVKRDFDSFQKWIEDFIAGRVSIVNTSRVGIAVVQTDACTPGASITNSVPFFPSNGPPIVFATPVPQSID